MRNILISWQRLLNSIINSIIVIQLDPPLYFCEFDFLIMNEETPAQKEIKNDHPKVLRRLMHNIFKSCPHHHLFPTKTYEVNFSIFVIEQKPLYVSDGDICIQASIGLPPELANLKPFNRGATAYYAPHQKPHILFNCHDSTLEDQPSRFPGPYHPSFHFKDFNRFKEGREKAKILQKCERIQIKNCMLILVNICNSGFYGPLFVINKLHKPKTQFILRSRVQNILFCSEFVNKFEEFRMLDMKSFYEEEPLPDDKQDLLTYHLRSYSQTQNAAHKSFLVSLDKSGLVLRNRKSQRNAYLPLGNLPEIVVFKRPLEEKYVSKPHYKINYSKIYSGHTEKPEQQANQSEFNVSLWSDDNKSEGDIREDGQNEMEIQQEGQQIDKRFQENWQVIQIESDQSQPDILRTIYQEANAKKVI